MLNPNTNTRMELFYIGHPGLGNLLTNLFILVYSTRQPNSYDSFDSSYFFYHFFLYRKRQFEWRIELVSFVELRKLLHLPWKVRTYRYLSVTVFFISSIIWVNLINYATWSILYCRYSIVLPEHMHVINEVPGMIKIQISDFQKVTGRIRIRIWVKTRRKN